MGNDFAQEFIIGAVMVQQVLFAGSDQLGGQEPGQKVHGNTVLNHSKQFAVKEQQPVHGGHFRFFCQDIGKLFIFFIK